MKTLMRHWWTGMIIVAIGQLPFDGLQNILKYFYPHLPNGELPHWWVVLSFSLMVASFLVAPLIVRLLAREILKTDGWLGTHLAVFAEKQPPLSDSGEDNRQPQGNRL
jgi:hypothetical protein